MPAGQDLFQNWDYAPPWYHGSPHRLETLLEGSTITQDADLARVFSHKPQVVCLEDETTPPRLRHNGTAPGLLYILDEPVTTADVSPHPRSSMAPGLEWLTRRPLRVRLLGPVELRPEEWLSPEAIEVLMRTPR